MGFPWVLTISMAVCLLAIVIFMISEQGRAWVRWTLVYEKPKPWLLIVPTGLSLLYVFYAHFTVGVQPDCLWRVLLWLFAPYVLFCLVKVQAGKPSWWDAVGIVVVILPFDLRVLGDRIVPQGYKPPLDWALLMFFSTITMLFVWMVYRNFETTDRSAGKVCLSFSRAEDWRTLTRAVVIAGPIVIAIGLMSGFLSWNVMHGRNVLSVAWALLQDFGKMLIGVACQEEVIFRAVILGILLRVLKAENRALIVTTVLFGLWHLPQAVPKGLALGQLQFSLVYALISAIAGYAYGLVYLRTRSILFPMCMHALFDTDMHILFR